MMPFLHPLLLILILFVTPTMAGTSPEGQTPDRKDENPVLAEVNGESIRLQDLRDYVARHPLMRGYMGSQAGIRMVLDDMVNTRLLQLEGQRQGIPLYDGERPQDETYVMRVRAQLVKGCELPDAAAARAFYDTHPELFSSPAYGRISRVYLPEGQRIQEQSAHDFLLAQAKAIHEGHSRFDDLVNTIRPLLPKDAKIGDMGFLPLVEDSPLIKALASAPVGSIVGPFVSDGNVYLFQLTQRHDPELTPWSKAEAEAPKVAQNVCRREAFQALRTEMIKHFPVIVHEDVLNQLKPF